MIEYFAKLSWKKIILWCYLIWYLVNVYFYFDPSPAIWLNSLGISLIIGFALMLSVSNSPTEAVDPWQTFRLFAMPFCVSSFAALIKDQGFFLIIPPKFIEQIFAVGFCCLFVAIVYLIKFLRRSATQARI